MIDSHCHIDLEVFDDDRQTILNNCIENGISRLLVPGLTSSQFSQLLLLSEEYHMLDIALGCHPYFLDSIHKPLKEIESQLQHLATLYNSKFVAIGECGLDNRIEVDIAYQKSVLSIQIELAKQLKKPLILHHRQSHNELIKLLKEHKFEYGGILHAFSGSEQIAGTYIDLGFKLGVGGTITYPRAVKTRKTIKHVSLNHLVLETDSPDMPLCGYQGERNTPLQLRLVAESLSELKQKEFSEIVAKTSTNYFNVLNLN